MDFLFVSYVVKRVDFKILEHADFTFYGSNSTLPPNLISVLQAWKLLLGGCSGYPVMMVKGKSDGPVLEDIPVARGFSDVFTEGFSVIP